VLVGLFGQLTPHKGAQVFVEAGRAALAEEPSLRFVIAGAGPASFRREVARSIASSGFAERFTLLPPQPSGQRLMRATDVVCLATSTPDPLPRVVLEGMAAGKPIAAYRSGGTAEMVRHGETGLLVDSGDVGGLSRAFVTLARDAGLRARKGAAGARRAQAAFSLELHLDRMEQLFRDVAR
jgi:glycosyltransferase involved in cell wall biosynthesis